MSPPGTYFQRLYTNEEAAQAADALIRRAGFTKGVLVTVGAHLAILLLMVVAAAIEDHYRAKPSAEAQQPTIHLVQPSNTPTVTFNAQGGWQVYTRDITPDDFDQMTAYDKAFNEGIEFTKGTWRMIRRNERKLGRKLTDEEIEGIIETREKTSGAVIVRHKL